MTFRDAIFQSTKKIPTDRVMVLEVRDLNTRQSYRMDVRIPISIYMERGSAMEEALSSAWARMLSALFRSGTLPDISAEVEDASDPSDGKP